MKNKILVLFAVLMMMAAAVSAAIVTVTENGDPDAYPNPDDSDGTGVETCITDDDWGNINTVTITYTAPGYLSTVNMVNEGNGLYCRFLSDDSVNAVNDMTVDYDVLVTYDDASTDTVSGDYTYDDEAPVADADGPYFCDEGESIWLDGSNSVDNLGIASYLWSAPNGGIFTDPTVENPVFTCYSGNGLYTLSLMVTDFGGRTDTDTSTVTVNNVAPIADANGPYICTEGQSIVLDGSGSSDPGLDALTYAWDLDNDGLFDDAFVVNPTYNCVEGLQIIPIALRVSDEEDSSTDTSQITIINSAPRVTNLQVVGGVINEGTPMTLRVTFTDFGPDTHDAVINWGDGSIDTVVDPANSPFERVHTYDDGDNAYTITVIVTDDDLASDTETLDVFVNNVAPTADADGPYNAELGVGFCGFLGSSFDPAGVFDTYTYTWDFDYDGITFDTDATGVDLTNPCWLYGALGDYTVALQVCDEDGGCSSLDTTTVTVWDYVVDLHTGWNLISIPLVPLDESGNIDTSIQNVLLDPLGSALADDVEYPILSFQFNNLINENIWYQSTRTGTGNGSTLNEVVPGYAYWIKIDTATQLLGNGQPFNAWGMPPQVNLQTKTWNLIGKYGITPVQKALQTEDVGYNDVDMRNLADYPVVEVDDEDLSQGSYLGPLDWMLPREGYWTFTGGHVFQSDEPVVYIPSCADYDDCILPP